MDVRHIKNVAVNAAPLRICPLCGSKQLGLFLTIPDKSGETVEIFECARCFSFVPNYFERWQSWDSLDAQVAFHDNWWRADEPEELQKLEADLTTMVADFHSELGEASPDNVIVEIGAGRGGLLKGLQNNGYTIFGCEPSEFLVSIARGHYKLDEKVLRCADAEEFLRYLADEGIQPNAVFLWHVLEHVKEPLELLRKLAVLLGPGGRILMQIPLVSSEYIYPEHYFFGTELSIKFIADILGLSLIREEVDSNLFFRTVVFKVAQKKSGHTILSLRKGKVPYNRAELITVRDKVIGTKSEIVASQARLVQERWDAMTLMGLDIAERDETIMASNQVLATQAKAVEGKDAALQRLTLEVVDCNEAIRSRDEIIAGQARLVEGRWDAMQQMGLEISIRDDIIRNKDEIIAGQARLVEERWDAMQQMGLEISIRDDIIRNKDEIIAGQARLVEERWDAMQQMGLEISIRDDIIRNKDEIIAGQACLVEERWDAMQQMGREIHKREEQLNIVRSHPITRILGYVGLLKIHS